jgi:superfamily I DNA and/or RNA helicase
MSYDQLMRKRDLQSEIGDTKDSLKARRQAIERELLCEADVVGATCTGSGGPELRNMGFDLVIMDEGSQCSE